MTKSSGKMREGTTIVIPLYKQFAELHEYELISFTQACRKLGRYHFTFVTHRLIDVDAYVKDMPLGFDTIYFEEQYFKSIAGYNRLLMSRQFYSGFPSYKFILICQLDVFVFADMLTYFEELDYDYIGAPWFESFGSAATDTKIMGVGNGGFSLRKVSSVLEILDFFDVFRPVESGVSFLKKLANHPVSFLKVVKHEALRKKHSYPTVLPWQQLDNEDIYWSMYIKGFFPWYKVGSVTDAIAFAFEARPELLYTLNQHNLPMGAHAWQRYNLDFWRPYIEQFGYQV